ncbi:MAG: S8 family serine peptidase [Bacteroidota bacterium]
MSAFRCFLLVTLVASCLSAAPAWAQADRTVSPLMRALHQEADSMRQVLNRWRQQTARPLRLAQPGGGWVAVVGLERNRPRYRHQHNDRAAVVTGVRDVHPNQAAGLRLTGLGQRIGMWDAGLGRADHQEFGGRLIHEDVAGQDNHATHVAGTLIAQGLRAEARGMAYEATVASYDWDDDATEVAAEAQRGLLVSNHSYGPIAGWYFGDLEGTGSQWYWLGDPSVSAAEDYTFGWYDAEAATFDRVAHEHPFLLPVISAGNDRVDTGPSTGPYRALDASGQWVTALAEAGRPDADGQRGGYDTLAGAATAKNVLTVGAMRLTPPFERVIPAPFSSFGPTDDGRIKPDLMGIGYELFSTWGSSTNDYRELSGTSMSAPNVTGAVALLQQHAQDLTGRSLRAATMKGLLIHTASDLGLPGPDFLTGWGLLDVAKAAGHLRSATTSRGQLAERVLEPGALIVETLEVDSTGPLRVTISWTDPPSTRLPFAGPATLDDSTRHLRNDLDIRLIHEASSTRFLPYVLTLSRPGKSAARGDNVVDPVEQIYVQSAPPGTYRLEISHKGTLVSGAPQPFSLLVTGATSPELPVAVRQFEGTTAVGEVTFQVATLTESQVGQLHLERRPRPTGPDVGEPYERVATTPLKGGTEGAQYALADRSVPSGRYQYRLVIEAEFFQYTAAETEVVIPFPDALAVLSSFPNPTSGPATLVFDLPDPTSVELTVFDALGRQVATVLQTSLQAGRHRVEVDGSRWAPGVYIARLVTREGARTHRLLIAR